MTKVKIICDVGRDLYRIRNPKTGLYEWISWDELERWRVYMRYIEHPNEIELIPEYSRRLITRTGIEHIGTDMSKTIEEAPRLADRNRLRRWGSSLTKANSRNKQAKNFDYFMRVTLLKHPKLGQWFADPTVPRIVREQVKLFYNTLLGSLQGKRPEYILSVLITIASDQHKLPYEPKYALVDDFHFDTWHKYYMDVNEMLRERLHTFRRADGSRGRFEFLQKR